MSFSYLSLCTQVALSVKTFPSKKNLSLIRNMSSWQTEKSKVLKMDLDAKRKIYKVKEHVTLDQVPLWRVQSYNVEITDKIADLRKYKAIDLKKELNDRLSEKISIWKGDITKLEVDAIVNAANSRLAGGGGVDGAIHRAAGPELKNECLTLNGCTTGDAKITGGYCLPAKHVIHTVGPQDKSHSKLQSCYDASLRLVRDNNLRSVAFPCVSTGIYGFPNEPASVIALCAVRRFLEEDFYKHGGTFERVIFCVFEPKDEEIYLALAGVYFPLV